MCCGFLDQVKAQWRHARKYAESEKKYVKIVQKRKFAQDVESDLLSWPLPHVERKAVWRQYV